MKIKVTLLMLMIVSVNLTAKEPFRNWLYDSSVTSYISVDPSHDLEPDTFGNFGRIVEALPLQDARKLEIYESRETADSKQLMWQSVAIAEETGHELFFTAGDDTAKAYVYTKGRKVVKDLIMIFYKSAPGEPEKGNCTVIRLTGRISPYEVKVLINNF